MANTMRRSREDLLRVLLDTATDLTALRDVEAVLQAIVRRTRAIVGADMAYISLNDPERGDTYIRQSDGVTTPAYRALRMPLGVGVLGQVATGLAPFQTSGYLTDTSVVHDPEVDEIVRAEAVETIMGAPLTVAGRVIGALIVAERRSRRFEPEEVSCVESIAKQAAVAIDNSLRFEEMARRTELLNVEHRRSAAELQLATRMLELDRRLLDAVMVSPDVDRVLTIGRGALDDDLYLRDASGGLLAATVDRDAAGADTGADGADTDTDTDAVPEPGTAVAITAAAETLGTLHTGSVLDADGRALMERVAVHAALALLFSRAEEDADLRGQHELVDDLLSGVDLPHDRLERRMRRWGLRSDDRLWCVALDVSFADARRYRQVLRAAIGRTVMTVHDDHLCLLTASPGWEDGLRAAFDARGWPLRAGSAGPVTAPRDLPDAHRRASLALGSLVTLGRDGVLDGEQLGMVHALLDLARAGGLPRSLTRAVDPLLDYDDERGTDLARTAFHYLETDGSVARVAELLHLHRNTVRQRLARIGVLLGAGWDASPRRLETHLALHVRDAQVGLRRPA
ncbi:helix-turn-helix domain-containing protein [Nocardiopsis aegyptia]|uniref:GAF domain-containing protein n=1 Tax=Nocardiopsis aegyptia TaxID=220378 RepID=A0A7Z0EMA8_9ACTN|nr:helix-turn-helix domain-containing protein [Nocardiopsis aegyptia]NYJ34747.1 GAF domain-containing protein [Nocardiopsis aegyptia]